MVNGDGGPNVLLRSGVDDHLVRCTAALQRLSNISIGRVAIIGGFAVMVRARGRRVGAALGGYPGVDRRDPGTASQ
jgi:hypothetical protein